jgi:hypothetical protein
LDQALCLAEAPNDDLLALNEALEKLARDEPGKAELVKLHYFAGLSLEEASRVLGISHRTAKRHWAYARAWLYAAIRYEAGLNEGCETLASILADFKQTPDALALKGVGLGWPMRGPPSQSGRRA